MSALDLVKLSLLMERGEGTPEIAVALIDGPVAINHPDLGGAMIREIPGELGATCTRAETAACTHGTFVAGVLSARRGSAAPAICPGCTLLVRPIFAETDGFNMQMPSATPEALAEAIVDSVNAGARVINLSCALVRTAPKGETRLATALDYAGQRGVIVIAAAGNQGAVGASVITRHPWVISVVACSGAGLPLSESNLGKSIGQRGLRAPGENISSLGPNGKSDTFSGSSVATPFVAGAAALLWSQFPSAPPSQIKWAVMQAGLPRRAAIVPPLLDAWAAHRALMSAHGGSYVS